jgi:MSHA biogenesis protein MshN
MQTLPQIAAVKPASAETPAPLRPATPVVEPRIDRQASGRPAEVAETLYRRAVGFINQGRVSEGIEELRGALGADPRHDSARQTLVALLLEQKRSEEAAGFLQQGLAVSPSNSGFTMLLARIMVEHQDVPGALALLQKHAAAGAGNADYRAFTAALLQQQSRHKESVDEYLAALRIAPQTGVWWVGLAISQEAMEKKSDAFESFQRARATRSLSPDVAAYAEQRVRQLQPAQ